MSQKIIIAGGRDFDDYFMVELAMSKVAAVGDEVVSGNALGADRLGEEYAAKEGHEVKIFMPNWNKYGKKAGMMRNHDMAVYADVLIAFWDGESNGTRNMIQQALSNGLELHVYRY